MFQINCTAQLISSRIEQFLYLDRSCYLSVKQHHEIRYIAFHRFGQAEFAYGGLILDSSQFLMLSQLPLKMMLDLNVVKIDSKIIIPLH